MRAALPCRPAPARAAGRREKARTPGRRPHRHTGSTPRTGAHAPARRAGSAGAHLPVRNCPRSS